MSGVVERRLIIQPVPRHRPDLAWAWRLRFAALPLLLLLLWQLSASYRLVSLLVLPSPAQTWAALREVCVNGMLASALEVSLRRLATGYVLGVALGVPLGLAFAISPVVRKLIAPSFWFIVRIPPAAWIPFLMVLFGIGEALKLVIIAKAVMMPVTINTELAIRSIPPGWRELGRLYRLSPLLTLRRILFPATILPLFTGLRLGLIQSWQMLIFVELLASSNGIGYQLTMARQLFQLDTMLALMVVVGVIGFALDRALGVAERGLARNFGGAA
jgi:sulfonate transport system permease protein